ncbi:iron-containing redox enzyme family protein [Brachybacterium sp. GCM10030267]|uniref:iron-containing redox enzyme family protein n=1 Tax=unclassified Brachybacterium TaxID=2623841 RepID=UPI00361B5BCA
MLTPTARGSLSDAVLDAMRSGETARVGSVPEADGPDDVQIALWSLFELHHRGFDDVADELEWDPHLIGLRRQLEQSFEQELRDRAPEFPEPGDFAENFFAFVAGHDGPSVVGHLQSAATADQMRQFLRHKSIYTLKESDHTTWTIPRLTNRVKAAVVELQYDEYGGGDPNRLHAQLFARGLEASGLSSEFGAYIDEAPLEILEQDNVMSMFGLNRRLRAASLGFLGAFEATSSAPSRKVARGLERLGFPAEIIEYYTEHVEADAVHEQLAIRNVCGTLLEENPDQYENIYFGAWASMHVDDRYAERMLAEWAA